MKSLQGIKSVSDLLGEFREIRLGQSQLQDEHRSRAPKRRRHEDREEAQHAEHILVAFTAIVSDIHFEDGRTSQIHMHTF